MQSLRFAPRIEELAIQIVEAITLESPKGYNGVHLRIEGDAMHAGFVSAVAGNNSAEVSNVSIPHILFPMQLDCL